MLLKLKHMLQEKLISLLLGSLFYALFTRDDERYRWIREIEDSSFSAMKQTIESLQAGLQSMAIDETNKTREKNREKQEKMREYEEKDRQLAVIRVSRVVKGLNKSYSLLNSLISV